MEVPNLAQNMGSQLGSTCTLLEQILPGATPGESNILSLRENLMKTIF